MNARIGSTLAVALLLAACGPKDDPQAAAKAAAAESARVEQLAVGKEKEFEDAFARSDWKLARGYGDSLQMDYPNSAAAKRIQPKLDVARGHIRDEENTRRLAALWAYQTQPAKGGTQISAAIYSKQEVDTGGGKRPVRLIFRDHPEWGKSAYLVLEKGDFDCYAGCKVKVTIDDGKPKSMAASRPKTDEAIAMFIEDEGALWRMAQQAKTGLSIDFPVKAGGLRTAVFETGGADKSRLPKWR
ncbi:hypothetical protein [Noviluteimonas gilva]|uniref:Lipoprotein n=1 Tax=Noviluteimonas gilva TaxID=2682097 RepID=A0A7C9LGS3_9GAMM|nr:hypothetical protein [Lysobacter gilvus]MUV13440.1 hypothetical protein [Lysobacter gilvus]